MNLGADIAAALPELRRQAESRMTDIFTVFRATGNTTTDPDTLVETPEYATVLTDVKGRFQSSNVQPRDAVTPGVTAAETLLSWHTPVTTVGVLTGDIVECTAAVDPELVGLRVRVAGPFVKSAATARRFPVELVS